MENPWKVGWSVDTIYWWGCKKNYGVYRLINPDEPDHARNRVVWGGLETGEEAQALADELNAAESGENHV
jgi:hypothetical protein